MSQICGCKISLHLAWKSSFVGKITGHFSPTVPLSQLEVSCVVGDVGAPGGASENLQSRVCTISLHGCGNPGASASGALQKKKKKKKRKQNEDTKRPEKPLPVPKSVKI
jgi:hypothetical protein